MVRNSESTAQAESIRAIKAQGTAEAERTEAERQSKLSLAQSLAALAPNVAEHQSNDDQLGMLLALEAMHVNGEYGHEFDWLVDDALRTTLDQAYFNRR